MLLQGAKTTIGRSGIRIMIQGLIICLPDYGISVLDFSWILFLLFYFFQEYYIVNHHVKKLDQRFGLIQSQVHINLFVRNMHIKTTYALNIYSLTSWFKPYCGILHCIGEKIEQKKGIILSASCTENLSFYCFSYFLPIDTSTLMIYEEIKNQ